MDVPISIVLARTRPRDSLTASSTFCADSDILDAILLKKPIHVVGAQEGRPTPRYLGRDGAVDLARYV